MGTVSSIRRVPQKTPRPPPLEMAVVGARGPKYAPAPTFTAAMQGRMTSVTWSLTERLLFWAPVPRSRYRGLPGPSGDELPSDGATLSRGEWRGPQHTSCTCDTDCHLPEILPRSLHAVPSAKPSKKEGWWWWWWFLRGL